MRMFCSIVLLLISISAQAIDSLTYEKQIDAVVKLAMDKVGAGDYSGAYARLEKFSAEAAQFPDAWAKQLQQLQEFSQEAGKTVDCKFIKKNYLSGFLKEYVYLQRFDAQVLVWRLVFYKSNKDWKLLRVNVSDDLRELFDEANMEFSQSSH